ncbi:MAG: AAA family ATPase, partial [Flavobacteriales bacterium]|nr:AAA family ATPase [Flavobacteriales bacterium]
HPLLRALVASYAPFLDHPLNPPDRDIAGLARDLEEALGTVATPGQSKAMGALARLLSTSIERPALIMTGYAGTGKTTVAAALVQVMCRIGRKVILLAPTGRAAKVLGGYSGTAASTIHRHIYRMETGPDGSGRTVLASNKDRHAVYLVDEASMIGEGSGGAFGSRELLSDLLEFVFSGSGNVLVLIGDPAQLPPIGSAMSEALSARALRARGVNAGKVALTEVVRQGEGSGILANATAIRQQMGTSLTIPRFSIDHPDVSRVEGLELQEELESAFARYGQEEVCVITRSNKRAYQYSMQIRNRVIGHEEELAAGDRLMVVRNDYFWGGHNGRPELIANGEPIELIRVRDEVLMHGARYRWVEAAWNNGSERREGEFLLWVDALAVDAPAMPFQVRKAMQQRVFEGLEGPKRDRLRQLRTHPMGNALEVKYAYAVTCHKAQGGQWRGVFVDQGYLTEEMIDADYLKWLYTAVTRATDQLWLLNFHERFFVDGTD